MEKQVWKTNTISVISKTKARDKQEITDNIIELYRQTIKMKLNIEASEWFCGESQWIWSIYQDIWNEK